jgi:hypothetical protein
MSYAAVVVNSTTTHVDASSRRGAECGLSRNYDLCRPPPRSPSPTSKVLRADVVAGCWGSVGRAGRM